MRRTPPQWPWYLLMALAMAALFLAMRWITEGSIAWTDVTILAGGLLLCGLMVWLVRSAPWSVRWFAIGFGLGTQVEIVAEGIWARQQPAGLELKVSEGWYPLVVPIERMLVDRDWIGIDHAFWWAMPLAFCVSGGILGGCLLAGYYTVQFRRTGE